MRGGSADDMLFDGPVDARAAQREHDELAAALGSGGAEVEEIEDALARGLELPEGRADVLGAAAPDPDALERLEALSPAGLAHGLVAGIPGALAPLPNLLFPRDVLAVIGDGVHVPRMARPARRAEAAVALGVVGGDAALGAARPWSRGELNVEGGDILLPGPGVVVIGIGPRTRLASARRLATRLLAAGAAHEVIAACLPADGPFHLDLAMSMVDRDVVVLDPRVIGRAHALRWRTGHAPLPAPSLVEAMSAALGHGLGVIEAGEDGDRARRWDVGANVVALRPGVVVAYADNVRTNRRLEAAGVEVLPVPGEHLGRGRGGPRCLTCPVLRG